MKNHEKLSYFLEKNKKNSEDNYIRVTLVFRVFKTTTLFYANGEIFSKCSPATALFQAE